MPKKGVIFLLKKNSGYPAQAAAARTPDFLYILKAVAFSYAVSLVMLVPAALIATFRCFSDKGIALCANLICALGVLLCGFIAGRHSEKGGLIAGAVSGLVYTFILWLIGGLASQTVSFGACAVTALVIGIVCGAAGGILGINTKGSRRR